MISVEKIQQDTSDWKRLLGGLSLKSFTKYNQANVNFRADSKIYEESRHEIWLLIQLP